MDEKCLLQVENLQTVLRLYGISQNYHGNYTYVGFPNKIGNGSIFSLNMKLGMSNQCKDQRSAWMFLQFALGPTGMSLLGSRGFPASQSALASELDRMLNTGDQFGGTTRKITQEDYDKFMHLIEDTHIFSTQNATIQGIIQEEALAYFHSDISDETAASQIQNRVQLYLSERQ